MIDTESLLGLPDNVLVLLFTYVPCGWLWLTAWIHLFYLSRHTQFIILPNTWLTIARPLCAVIVSTLTLMYMFAVPSDETRLTVTHFYLSSSIWAVSCLLASLLTVLSQMSGVTTPCVVFIFWTLALVSYSFSLSSMTINQDDASSDASLVFITVIFGLILAEFLLHCIGDIKVIPIQSSLSGNACPNTGSSFLSRLTCSWIFKLVLKGYKKSIALEDIPDAPYQLQTRNIVPTFLQSWKKEIKSTQQTNRTLQIKCKRKSQSNGYDTVDPWLSSSKERAKLVQTSKRKSEDSHIKRIKPSLYKTILRFFFLPMFKAQMVGLMGDVIQFINPILLHKVINYAENREEFPVMRGIILAISFAVVTLINLVTTNYRFYHAWNIGFQIKVALSAAVYKKSLMLTADSKRRFTTGMSVNLMSVDCQKFVQLCQFLFGIIAAPVQVVIAFYMLFTTLGVSFVAGIVLIVILIPVNIKISSLAIRTQSEQICFKDQRIKLTSEILNGIRVLKMYAWESFFLEKVSDIRKNEVAKLKKSLFFLSINTLYWQLSPVLMTVVTFITYTVVSDRPLTASTAFVSLSLLSMIKQPMVNMTTFSSLMVQCHVSMGRLRDYLCGEELEDIHENKVRDKENSIQISDGTFKWDKDATPVLHNITVQIAPGKLVAVVGQVGSGKSSLLSAFLGEMERVKGNSRLNGSTAYVPQQAWIQHMSLKSNVLFGRPMDQKKYEQVITACTLNHDINILPFGDLTEIGEKGINLSGGQKQRVSIARALYQDTDVYLLDDPLSAVDSHVGKHIFDHAIGPNSLLKEKTRVLVTHSIQWLPQADIIIVMDQGRLTETGSFPELMNHDGPFAQYIKTYLLEHKDEEMDNEEVEILRDKISHKEDAVTSDKNVQQTVLKSKSENNHLSNDIPVTSTSKNVKLNYGSTAHYGQTSSKLQDTSVSLKPMEEDSFDEQEQLVKEEKVEEGQVRLAVFVALVRAFGILPAIAAPLCLILYNVLNVCSGIWLAEWTGDQYLSNKSHHGTDLYSSKSDMYLSIYSVIQILQVLGTSAFIMLIRIQIVNASSRLHDTMLTTVLHQPMSFFDTTPIGRLLNRVSKDVNAVDITLGPCVRLCLHMLFNIISIFSIITFSVPVFLIAATPLVIIYILFQKFYIPSSRQFRRLESTTNSPIYSHFAESIQGASSIRAYNCCDNFFQESQDMMDVNIGCFIAYSTAQRWLRIRLEILGTVVIFLAALFSVLDESVSGNLVGLTLSYALQVTSALNMMMQQMAQVEMNSISVERIVEYSSLPYEPDWIVKSKRPPVHWPQFGEIVFRNYSTRYRENLNLVLKSISFKIVSGEKVGVVGRTGAGKSSLSSAILRVVEAVEGDILIDDIDITKIGLHDLRSKITILPQDPVLFSGSVRFNIDPTSTQPDDVIWEALQDTHLSDFVRDLPGQLDYVCEEGGNNLSVGQRQLMCLARSLLRKTKILILDEATAAVDLETDFWLQNTIRGVFKDCTVLTVAHRLNTIIDYDKILVLVDGEVMEYDSPENLLANTNGIFYSMARESDLV